MRFLSISKIEVERMFFDDISTIKTSKNIIQAAMYHIVMNFESQDLFLKSDQLNNEKISDFMQRIYLITTIPSLKSLLHNIL